MAVGAGDLDRRIKIFKKTITSGGLSDSATFSLDRTIWAKATYISDGEKFRAGSTAQNLQMRFIIRKTTISHDSQIEFDGRKHEVLGIKEIDKSFLEITTGFTK